MGLPAIRRLAMRNFTLGGLRQHTTHGTPPGYRQDTSRAPPGYLQDTSRIPPGYLQPQRQRGDAQGVSRSRVAATTFTIGISKGDCTQPIIMQGHVRWLIIEVDQKRRRMTRKQEGRGMQSGILLSLPGETNSEQLLQAGPLFIGRLRRVFELLAFNTNTAFLQPIITSPFPLNVYYNSINVETY